MRGLVFNLLNARLRESQQSDGWDWLFDEEDPAEIHVDLDSVVMPLAEPGGLSDSFHWSRFERVPRARKPN
jgi:hypothetical protein